MRPRAYPEAVAVIGPSLFLLAIDLPLVLPDAGSRNDDQESVSKVSCSSNHVRTTAKPLRIQSLQCL